MVVHDAVPAPVPLVTASFSLGPCAAGDSFVLTGPIWRIIGSLTCCPSAPRRPWRTGSRSIPRSRSSIVTAVPSLPTVFAVAHPTPCR